jgi:putative transposase
MCKTLRVSTSGYYAWSGRVPSSRATANVALVGQIREVFDGSDQTYGMPRMRAALADEGVVVNRKRVARLMHQGAMRGVSRRRGYVRTTQSDARQAKAPDLVKRAFTATGIKQLWVADMTYLPTWAGLLCLAVVLKPIESTQYTSLAFGKRCEEMNVRASMDTVGGAYDNAMAESFFASLECELIERRVWKTLGEARRAVFTWIESWYNPRQLHSSLGYQSPNSFERKLQETGALTISPEHGLPTGCFAHVDSPLCALAGAANCPQASPVDNPAPAAPQLKKTQT